MRVIIIVCTGWKINYFYFLFFLKFISLKVYIGTKSGGLVVMDVQGNPVTRVELCPFHQITGLTWNCEKFNMEEREGESQLTPQQQQQQGSHEESLGVFHFRKKNYFWRNVKQMNGSCLAEKTC
jgi:hypothetical protein